jgi:hypothetical protein
MTATSPESFTAGGAGEVDDVVVVVVVVVMQRLASFFDRRLARIDALP